METDNIYIKMKKEYSMVISKTEKKINKLSNIRLLVFILGVCTTILVFSFGIIFSVLSVFLFGGIFFYLIIIHQKNIDILDEAKIYYEINDKGIKRVENTWYDFNESGEEYIDIDHNYSKDLDIFGKFSLFQWINSTVTPKGKKIFSKLLLNPLKDSEKIKERQEAIEELSSMFSWRQKLNVNALLSKKDLKEPNELIDCIKEPIKFINNKFKVIIVKIIPVVVIILLVFTFVIPVIPKFILFFVLFVQGIVAFSTALKYSKKFSKLNKYKDDILIYNKLLNQIESTKFNSDLLNSLKIKLENENGKSAHYQLKNLEKVISMIEVRYNMFYLVINILFLWDLQCIVAYEKWKSKSDTKINDWLDVVGWFESFASLSIVKYDNKDWIYPKICEDDLVIEGKEVGHPLLGKSRVCNDIKLTKKENVLLITGSNMSGKSTYLRTVGFTLLMSYYGMPVCAKSFRCSVLKIYTCMRISDNLEKNISSFYAELLRIKMVIEALKDEEPVFFLLDEIFKGTNSIDRHIGAKELIVKLSKKNTLGLVSTHDLELGELENLGEGKIKNKHFKEYYENNQIKFDYKIHKGICETRNAVYLMEMIGLKIKKT